MGAGGGKFLVLAVWVAIYAPLPACALWNDSNEVFQEREREREGGREGERERQREKGYIYSHGEHMHPRLYICASKNL